MATIVGPQIITIGADVALSLKGSWSPKYANELKKGNTSIKKAATASNGDATLRISHQVTRGIEGHVISLEVEGVRGADPARRLVKAQMVITYEDGNSEEAALAADVTSALCTYVPTVITDVFEDVID